RPAGGVLAVGGGGPWSAVRSAAERAGVALPPRLHHLRPRPPPLGERGGGGGGGPPLFARGPRRSHRPLPAPRRDRPARHGRGRPRARQRPRPRPRPQDPARPPPGPPGDDPALRRGGADRRTAPAPGHRPRLRAGTLPRRQALLHHEARQGEDPRRSPEREE